MKTRMGALLEAPTFGKKGKSNTNNTYTSTIVLQSKYPGKTLSGGFDRGPR